MQLPVLQFYTFGNLPEYMNPAYVLAQLLLKADTYRWYKWCIDELPTPDLFDDQFRQPLYLVFKMCHVIGHSQVKWCRTKWLMLLRACVHSRWSRCRCRKTTLSSRLTASLGTTCPSYGRPTTGPRDCPPTTLDVRWVSVSRSFIPCNRDAGPPSQQTSPPGIRFFPSRPPHNL